MTTKLSQLRSISGRVLLAALAGLFLFMGPVPVLAQPVPGGPNMTAPDSTSPVGGPDYNYILGPSDVVHVEALNHPDFNVKATIGADGRIQLPYIGSFNSANMTVAALHDRVLDDLKRKGIFSNVTLNVEVISFGSRYVTVLGGVGTPGLVPVDRAYRLSEILARAGGVREGGSDYVDWTSKVGATRRIAIEDLATGGPSMDPYVSPGDKIFVPTAVFYIKGQVKAPGAYPVGLNMTLAMALARGGGLTDMGSNKNISITRNNAEIDPKDLAFQIQANDVIDVGESWF
jgi:polysaccharide export outer membrane protein